MSATTYAIAALLVGFASTNATASRNAAAPPSVGPVELLPTHAPVAMESGDAVVWVIGPGQPVRCRVRETDLHRFLALDDEQRMAIASRITDLAPRRDRPAELDEVAFDAGLDVIVILPDGTIIILVGAPNVEVTEAWSDGEIDGVRIVPFGEFVAYDEDGE
jgi:hypothetical protein